MTIPWLGNSLVATVPTMLDIIVRGGKGWNYGVKGGDLGLFVSARAEIHINSFLYRF